MSKVLFIGGQTPFVKYPQPDDKDQQARLKGLVLDLFKSQYGKAARLYVTEVENILAPVYNDDGEEAGLRPVAVDEVVNAGIKYRAFDGIKKSHVGNYLEIVHLGFGEARRGQNAPHRWRVTVTEAEPNDPLLELLQEDDWDEADDE